MREQLVEPEYVLVGRGSWRGMEPHALCRDASQPVQEVTEMVSSPAINSTDVQERRAVIAPRRSQG